MGAQAQAWVADDLDALFEQAAAQGSIQPEPQTIPAPPAKADAVAANAAVASPAPDSGDLHQRIGQLTRALHDALHGLGYDQNVVQVMHGLPDTRDRLNYIAQLTGEAAEKALNCVDRGQEIQAQLGADASALSRDWASVLSKQMAMQGLKAAAQRTPEFLAQDDDLQLVSGLAQRTREFLDAVPRRTGELGEVLTDIMMAQDFHDLTGQVIKKIIEVARFTEEQLVVLLVETTPPGRRAEIVQDMSGPVVNPTVRSDVVTDQSQVDDLLEKLGF